MNSRKQHSHVRSIPLNFILRLSPSYMPASHKMFLDVVIMKPPHTGYILIVDSYMGYLQNLILERVRDRVAPKLID